MVMMIISCFMVKWFLNIAEKAVGTPTPWTFYNMSKITFPVTFISRSHYPTILLILSY